MTTLAIKRCLFALAGLIFEGLLIFFGLMVSGGGHYNLPFYLALSPGGSGLLIWPLVGYLFADLSSTIFKIIFVLLLFASYVGIFFYARAQTESDSYWYALGAKNPEWLAAVNRIYLFYGIGQLLLWGRFFYFVFKKSPTKSDES